MSEKLKLGFVGLGIMGAPMAGHLVKAGHEVFINTRSKVPPELASTAAIQCSSPSEVAQKADIIFMMVPDTPDVEKVLFADKGIAAGLSKGKVVVDMSSISPIATKEYAKKVNALGCDYLDAPVSGGEVGAKNPRHEADPPRQSDKIPSYDQGIGCRVDGLSPVPWSGSSCRSFGSRRCFFSSTR